MAKKIIYTMKRGDSRSLPVKVPIETWVAGGSIYFALKTSNDNVLDDSSAIYRKQLTNSDIISTDAKYVNLRMKVLPAESTTFTPGTYIAEFEYVSPDRTIVLSFPDGVKEEWYWTIKADTNRRY